MALQKTIVLRAIPDSLSLNGKSMEGITTVMKSPSKVSILIDSKRKDVCASNDVSPAPVRKRQRLDHLTLEEKIQRRKLKNRVAAQCARDRKKEKMNKLEDEIQVLKAEKEILMQENFALQQKNLHLEEENSELRKRLQDQTTDNKESVQKEILLQENFTLQQKYLQLDEENNELRKRLQDETIDNKGSQQVDRASIKQEKDSCSSLEHASPINVSLQQKQDLQLFTLLMMRFLCLRMIVSLMTFLICLNSAARNCYEKVPFPLPLETKETPNAIQKSDPVIKWWGPHQKNWNPSKN